MASRKLLLPCVGEQERIANFLDEQTARIDALIAEKKQLQNALVEWQGAELNRICFGGLAATEATGNTWIQRIPKGWRLARLKHLVAGIEQGWSPECESRPAEASEWGVLKAGASNGGAYREAENKALPSGLEPRPDLEVQQGDVLISRASGSADLVGSFAYVHKTRPRLMLSDKNFRLRFFNEPTLLPELLAWMCNTDALRQQIRQYVSGADGLAKNIGSGNLRELWLAVPPPFMQKELVSSIQKIMLHLEGLATHLTDHIERLREYRSSLISATVTGRLNIDEFQARQLEVA
jgi:type I restriction enzyme S subunit